ncbi:MAG: TonB family protein [Melioribacteraceae bacterium]|nr:TonB family protein [Melioribacteraceae bacterium]
MKYLYILFFLTYIGAFAQTGIVKVKNLDGSISSEESFIDGVYDGTSYWFYKNGNIKTEKTFDRGKLNGWIRDFYDTGILKSEFYILNGIKNGIQKEYHDNGALSSITEYDNGIRIKFNPFEYDSLYITPIEAYRAGSRQELLRKRKKQEIICSVEICPEPIGGMKSINDNLVYPEEAKLYGMEGIVNVIARIDTDGNVLETYVFSGIGLGCDEAAIEAVKKTRFLPGQENGESVIADATLKIIFALDDRTKFLLSRKEIIPQKIPTKTEGLQIGEKTDIKPIKTFVCDFDQCPEPKKGLQNLLDKIEIPPTAKRLNIEGKIVILATIDEYGFARDTKIIEGLGYGIDEAVETAIFNTEFEAAKHNGKWIKANVTITLMIKK